MMTKKIVISLLSFLCATGVWAEQEQNHQCVSSECEQAFDDAALASKRIAHETLDLLQMLYQGRIPEALKKMIESAHGEKFLQRMYMVRNLANVSADLVELKKFFDDMTLLCEFVLIMEPQFAQTEGDVDHYFERFAEFLSIDPLNLDETVPAAQFYMQSKRDAAAKVALRALVDQLNQECTLLRDKLFSCTVEFDKKKQLCSHDNALLKDIITNLNKSLDAARAELQEKEVVNDALLNNIKSVKLELEDLKKIVAEKEAECTKVQQKVSKAEFDCSLERNMVADLNNNLQKTKSIVVDLRKTSNRKSHAIRQISDKMQSILFQRNVSLGANVCAAVAFVYYQFLK